MFRQAQNQQCERRCQGDGDDDKAGIAENIVETELSGNVKYAGRNQHGGDQNQRQPARAEDEVFRHEIEQNTGAQASDQSRPAWFGIAFVLREIYHK